MYRIIVTKTCEKDLKRLDRSTCARIIEKLEYLSAHPHLLQPLRHLPADVQGAMKYRIGDWRILCFANHTTGEITLLMAGHRRDIYRRLRN